MGKSTPTQYGFFVRHEEEGRDLSRPFHVIGRHVGEDALGKPKEEILFGVLVNQTPSSFFVDKDKLPPIAANEEIVFSAYAQVNKSDNESDRILWDPTIRRKSYRNPGDNPRDGSVVLDPIGSHIC